MQCQGTTKRIDGSVSQCYRGTNNPPYCAAHDPARKRQRIDAANRHAVDNDALRQRIQDLEARLAAMEALVREAVNEWVTLAIRLPSETDLDWRRRAKKLLEADK